MAALRVINLAIRFLLELTALGIFAYWGATRTASVLLRTAFAIGCPLSVAVFWGLFVSPKARVPTGRVGRAGLGLLVFLGAAAALDATGRRELAIGFATVALLSSLVVYVLTQ